MHIRSLSTMLAVLVLLTACDDNTKEQSPGEVLARDSALANDLRQADTSAFSEAADVAMAFDPDSAPPPPTEPAVPMRVDGSGPGPATLPAAAPANAPPPAPARAPMRPAPATIHSDPLPSRSLPARPTTSRAPSVRAPASSSGRASAPGNGESRASNAAAILEKVPGAALPGGAGAEPCASPARPDQRRCLMLHLARSDASLDRRYQELISQMKREAGTPPGAKEPETVERLRVAQRAWLVYRDTECRRRNRDREGPLWAPVRARCLAEFSSQREEELARALLER